MKLSFWATSNQNIQDASPEANPKLFVYGIMITPELCAEYNPQNAIHLSSLLLAIVFDRHNVKDIQNIKSEELRSGFISEANATDKHQIIYLTPKAIKTEYIKLKWTLVDMLRFNLRVRRWLSERDQVTENNIGSTLYAFIKDLDEQIHTLQKIH